MQHRQKGARSWTKQEPSIDQWLKEAKQDPKAAQCGMFLTHNGVVRITPKQQVREGVEGLGDVAQVEFSYDAAGVDAAVEEALTWPGVYYVRVWLNEGVLGVGDSIMYVLIGADIRPNCIDALQKLVGKIKNDLVVEKENLRVRQRCSTFPEAPAAQLIQQSGPSHIKAALTACRKLVRYTRGRHQAVDLP